MLLRLIAGGGLLALGYYLGKAVGRMDAVREESEADQRLDAGVAVDAEPSSTAGDRPKDTPD